MTSKVKVNINKLFLPESVPHKVTYCVVAEPDGVDVNTIEEAKTNLSAGEIYFGGFPSINEFSACFSSLGAIINKFVSIGKTPTKVIYHVNKEYTKKAHLDDVTIAWWVRTCKKFGLMPRNINKHFLETMDYVVEIKNLDLNQVYAYLITARHIQEEPAIIKATMHFFKDLKFDFFIAYALAHKIGCTNTGHSILPERAEYMLYDKIVFDKYDFIKGINIFPGYAFGFYNFINNYKPKSKIGELVKAVNNNGAVGSNGKKVNQVGKFEIQRIIQAMSKEKFGNVHSMEECKEIKIITKR